MRPPVFLRFLCGSPFDFGVHHSRHGIVRPLAGFSRLQQLMPELLPVTISRMIGLPARTEAAPYYFTYIDRIKNPDILAALETQLSDTLPFLQAISAEKSLHRYAPDKWSIRAVWNHVNDTERAFAFRALWFARGFDSPLPSFDQDIASRAARADEYSWESHIDEFRTIRLASLTLFRNMPADGWSRSGIASGNSFTVRALAYIIAGHVSHHRSILETRYL